MCVFKRQEAIHQKRRCPVRLGNSRSSCLRSNRRNAERAGVDVFVSVCVLLSLLSSVCVAVGSTSLVCAVRSVSKTQSEISFLYVSEPNLENESCLSAQRNI